MIMPDPETTERFAKLMCERDAEIVRLKFQSNAHRDAQIEGLKEITALKARLASAEKVVKLARQMAWWSLYQDDGREKRIDRASLQTLVDKADLHIGITDPAQSQPEKK